VRKMVDTQAQVMSVLLEFLPIPKEIQELFLPMVALGTVPTAVHLLTNFQDAEANINFWMSHQFMTLHTIFMESAQTIASTELIMED